MKLTFGRSLISNLQVVFGLVLVALPMMFATANAQNKVVVIPLGGEDGPQFERTVFVNGDGTPAQNGAALAAAVSQVAQVSFGQDPWLIKLEPGIFDVTASPITIANGMHLQGSGDQNTTITWSSGFGSSNNAIVVDSDSGSVSDLLLNATESFGAVFITVNSSITLRDVTYSGIQRGFVMNNNCNANNDVGLTVVGSTLRVTADPTGDNDIAAVNVNCNLTISSSRILGAENSDGLFIGGGNVTITNSFFEDSSSAVSVSNAICRGIATPAGFNTTTCP